MKLNNAQDAIKQAIEGGYEGWCDKTSSEWFFDARHRYGTQWVVQLQEYACFSDPLFWQALGKERGWKDEDISYEALQGVTHSLVLGLEAWAYYSMRWFSTRLSNGDESAFWQNLP